MRLGLLLCVVAVLASGCRKKTSREFYKLDSDQSILISRDGDDGYLSDEMTAVVAGLGAIPEDTVEYPRAQALLAKLTAEQARVAADRAAHAEKPTVPQPNPFAGRVTPTAVEPQPGVPEPVDAGEPQEPWTGMDEATFEKLFGRCFSKGPPLTLGRGVAATTRVLGPSADCQKRLGTPGSLTSYVFVDGGVFGKQVETYVVLDAGPPPPPPPPPPAPVARDAGEPILTIPGAPLPEGYQKSTVY